jgi:polysaccharide biosynthesis protein PelA
MSDRHAGTSGRDRWVVCYSASARVADLTPYGLVILDRASHALLADLTDGAQSVVGYLSAGEVGAHDPVFREAMAAGLLLEENPRWPGNRFVDVRDPRWAEIVCARTIAELVAAGFGGVFLDTLDYPSHLERVRPAACGGMARAAAALVHRIRREYPELLLIVNRGYDILADILPDIDAVVAESLYSTYDFERGHYRLVDPDLYLWQVAKLEDARAHRPGLRVLSLDY